MRSEDEKERFVLAEVHEAARAHWRRKVRLARPGPEADSWGAPIGRGTVGLLAAALLAAVAVASWWLASTARAPRQDVVFTEVLLGDLEVRRSGASREGEGRAPLQTEVRVGAEIAARSGAALRAADGTEIRLRAGSVLLLEGVGHWRLQEGAIYLDDERPASVGAGRASPSVPRWLHAGEVKVAELGTRFAVGREAGRTWVRVRSGAVVVRSGEHVARLDQGRGLEVTSSGIFTDLSVDAESWSWVLEAAPPFELEGRVLDDYLAWLTHETGWRFRTDAVAREVASSPLHGSLEGFAPGATLAVVAASLGLEVRPLSQPADEPQVFALVPVGSAFKESSGS